MRQYSYMHELQKRDVDFIDDPDLAKLVAESFGRMDSVEKRKMMGRVCTDRLVDDTLLKFVFFNTMPEKKDMTPSQLVKFAQNEIFRFQGRAGGRFIDDSVWVVAEDKDYEKGETTLVMMNTVDSLDGKDTDTVSFVKRLIYRLSAASDNRVTLRAHEDEEDKITRIQIRIKAPKVEKELNDI